ncbi:MAG TPA: type IV toxin-antitoxin system AbiEi family antitoxin domain-containing protein [Solirubrobacteraceae bacterium]|jgi:predicted transcriptional regulator of viral defense system|nr:type IV toxin-antitoxin system AbiEi family antitoxin domain-containing protein [Solirubrobacteraceae bacterium]
MSGAVFDRLAELADDQYGFLTQQQTRALGVQPMTLVRMAERGVLERRGHGLYRVAHFPMAPLDSYMEATLWPRGTRGVLSHETALELYELSDVNPSKIHITVPQGHRIRREIPALYRVHHETLAGGDVTFHEGIPIVTPAHAIRQCHAEHLGLALIGQAIDHGLRNGRLTGKQAAQLRKETGVKAGPGMRR